MNNLALLLTFAGIAHFGVLVASATVPKALNWRENLSLLPKLLRQMFWVYGAFIVLMIVSFGVITLMHTETLARGSNPLARSVCGMIALFWSVRLLVQFFVFDAKYSNSQIQARMPKRFWMLGEAVESCQARGPWATRPTLPSAKSARSQRDGTALGVLPRCAREESPSGLSVAGAPCSTPNGAPTYAAVSVSSSTKPFLTNAFYRIGYHGLTMVFIFLIAVYTWAAIFPK